MAAEPMLMPWVVVAPQGVEWLGHARGERDAWRIGLGYPDDAEIAAYKRDGWYAAQATLSWSHPRDTKEG